MPDQLRHPSVGLRYRGKQQRGAGVLVAWVDSHASARRRPGLWAVEESD